MADPLWANVTTYLRFNNAGSATVIDETGNDTWTLNGGATQSATGAIKGAASLNLLGNTGAMYASSTSNLAGWQFGTGDFTLDFTIAGGEQGPDFFTTIAEATGAWFLRQRWLGRQIEFMGLEFDPGAGYLTDGLPHTGRISRVSGVVYCQIDGRTDIMSPSSYAYTVNLPLPTGKLIGRASGADQWLNSKVDEFRVTKGVGRSTAAYTLSAGEFETGEAGNTATTATAAAGAATVSTVVGRALKRAAATAAAGVATVSTAVGRSTKRLAVTAAAGAATVSGVGRAILATAAVTAAGVGSASAQAGAAAKATAAPASGTAAVSALSGSGLGSTAVPISGIASVAASGVARAAGVPGVAAAAASVSAASTAFSARAVSPADGVASTFGIGAALARTTGTAAGLATVSAVGSVQAPAGDIEFAYSERVLTLAAQNRVLALGAQSRTIQLSPRPAGF